MQRQTRALTLTALSLFALAAQAQSVEFRATARAHVVDFLTNTDRMDNQQILVSTLPAVQQTYQFDSAAQLPDGGATANFLGGIGWLKAKAEASYAYCCSPTGFSVAYGGSDGTAQGSFADTVNVFGAGLAPGTPVSYRIDLRITGTLSNPSFEMGGALTADAVAGATLQDMNTGQKVTWSWDAKQQAPGLYSLTLNTQVGHQLHIDGSLFVQAAIGSNARTARSVSANFYNSAYFELAPSVAGLNTVGLSGHDFLAPVPEPSTAALWASAALLGLWLRRRTT